MLLLGELRGEVLSRMLEFVELDEKVDASSPVGAVLEACLRGIRVVECLPDDMFGRSMLGWKKFVTYMTAANAQILWESHRDARASQVGGWVLEALTRVGVQPDGFSTALGSAYSSTMSIHGSATTRDPRTGELVVRGGNEGRELAGL
jgi:hypothetical protein